MTTTDPNNAAKSRTGSVIGSILLIPPTIRNSVFGGFFLALLAVDIALAETHHFWAMLFVAILLILTALALIKIWWRRRRWWL